MNTVLLGLLFWAAIAVLAGLLVGRFMRMPRSDSDSGRDVARAGLRPDSFRGPQ